jgi:acid phosphatase (class A)
LAPTNRSSHVEAPGSGGYPKRTINDRLHYTGKTVKRLVQMLPLVAAAWTLPAAAQNAPTYLTKIGVDLRQIIPPSPLPNSELDKRDRTFFRTGRPATDSARWRLATSDADEAVPSMMHNFSAAVGVTLTPERYPKLAQLLLAMRPDIGAAVNAVKPIYAKPRPFTRDPGPVCQDKAMLARSFDYPSGHTTWGTSVALVLTELWPEHANAILARGRQYGESRYLCGAHSISAVDAGRQAAGALIAALHGSPRFRDDLEAVRQEISTAL